MGVVKYDIGYQLRHYIDQQLYVSLSSKCVKGCTGVVLGSKSVSEIPAIYFICIRGCIGSGKCYIMEKWGGFLAPVFF